MASLLHVRAVVPESLHALLLATLEQNPAVCNLVVVEGAGRRPAGNLVLFDVPREAADDIVEVLIEHEVHRDGAFSIEHVELSIGESTQAAMRLAPGDTGGAVLWNEVRQSLEDESGPSLQYFAFFVISALIAAVGILTDSPILIVGAMVVGPDFGPLFAMAFAAHSRDWWLFRRGWITFTAGAAAGVLTALLLGVVLQAIDRIPPSYLPGRPLTGFISQPDFFAPIVASAAAIGGALSITLTRSSALVGILISVTTLPAIADIGLGIATTNADEAYGSLRQLAINVVCLIVFGALTFSAQRAIRDRKERQPG